MLERVIRSKKFQIVAVAVAVLALVAFALGIAQVFWVAETGPEF